jgi:hypothetical protein
MIYELQRLAGKTQRGKLWISVENEEFLSKAVDFRDLSVGVSTAATRRAYQAMLAPCDLHDHQFLHDSIRTDLHGDSEITAEARKTNHAASCNFRNILIRHFDESRVPPGVPLQRSRQARTRVARLFTTTQRWIRRKPDGFNRAARLLMVSRISKMPAVNRRVPD